MERDKTATSGRVEREKIKTHFARIIVSGPIEKPVYDIMYYDPQNHDYVIGFGSYSLENVKKWLEEEFDLEGDAFANEPVRHAKWIDGADSFGAKPGDFRVCSYCNICIPGTRMIPDMFWQYCPNCGSKNLEWGAKND